MYREPSLASASNDMTFFMFFAMVSMASLFGGNTVLFGMKKGPLAQLHASGWLRYPGLLYESRVIWLSE